MKNGFFLTCVLVIAAAGGGYWLGRHRAQPSTEQISTDTTTTKSLGTSPSLPPVRSKRTPPTTEKAPQAGKLSLAEIEAKILEFKKKGPMNNYGFQGQKELFKMLSDVDTADIPQLLAFIEKNLPTQMRWGLRYQLLASWAESDVTAG